MRFVEYCDFTEVPDTWVHTIGSICLVRHDMVRVTLVVQRPDSSEYAVAARHVWRLGDFLSCGPQWKLARAEIERGGAVHAGPMPFDMLALGKAN